MQFMERECEELVREAWLRNIEAQGGFPESNPFMNAPEAPVQVSEELKELTVGAALQRMETGHDLRRLDLSPQRARDLLRSQLATLEPAGHWVISVPERSNEYFVASIRALTRVLAAQVPMVSSVTLQCRSDPDALFPIVNMVGAMQALQQTLAEALEERAHHFVSPLEVGRTVKVELAEPGEKASTRPPVPHPYVGPLCFVERVVFDIQETREAAEARVLAAEVMVHEQLKRLAAERDTADERTWQRKEKMKLAMRLRLREWEEGRARGDAGEEVAHRPEHEQDQPSPGEGGPEAEAREHGSGPKAPTSLSEDCQPHVDGTLQSVPDCPTATADEQGAPDSGGAATSTGAPRCSDGGALPPQPAVLPGKALPGVDDAGAQSLPPREDVPLPNAEEAAGGGQGPGEASVPFSPPRETGAEGRDGKRGQVGALKQPDTSGEGGDGQKGGFDQAPPGASTSDEGPSGGATNSSACVTEGGRTSAEDAPSGSDGDGGDMTHTRPSQARAQGAASSSGEEPEPEDRDVVPGMDVGQGPVSGAMGSEAARDTTSPGRLPGDDWTPLEDKEGGGNERAERGTPPHVSTSEAERGDSLAAHEVDHQPVPEPWSESPYSSAAPTAEGTPTPSLAPALDTLGCGSTATGRHNTGVGDGGHLHGAGHGVNAEARGPAPSGDDGRVSQGDCGEQAAARSASSQAEGAGAESPSAGGLGGSGAEVVAQPSGAVTVKRPGRAAPRVEDPGGVPVGPSLRARPRARSGRHRRSPPSPEQSYAEKCRKDRQRRIRESSWKPAPLNREGRKKFAMARARYFRAKKEAEKRGQAAALLKVLGTTEVSKEEFASRAQSRAEVERLRVERFLQQARLQSRRASERLERGNQVLAWRRYFQHIDTDGDKQLTYDELREAFAAMGRSLDVVGVKRVFATYDRDEDGVLDEREFIAVASAEDNEYIEHVTLVQAHVRGFLVRRGVTRVLPRRDAAVLVQAAFRGSRARKAVRQQRQAAVTIQRAWRKTALQSKEFAAVALQRKARGYLSRLDCQVQQRYAMMVQRNWRVKRDRKRGLQATKLQAAARGMLARRRVAGQQRAAERIQHLWWHHRKRHDERRERAARSIQAVARGALVRKHIPQIVAEQWRSEEGAVVTLQRAYRDWCLRKVEAATVLQAALRGMMDRRILARMHGSASVVQARWRGVLGRRKVVARVRGIVRLQALVRRHQARRFVYRQREALVLRKYDKFEPQIVTIQRAWGRHQERVLKHAAAAILQAGARGMLVRTALRRKMRPEQWRWMRRQRQLRRSIQRQRRRTRYVVEIVDEGTGADDLAADQAFRAALSPRSTEGLSPRRFGAGAPSQTPPAAHTSRGNAWSPSAVSYRGGVDQDPSLPSSLSGGRRLTTNGGPPAGAVHDKPHPPAGPRAVPPPLLVWSSKSNDEYRPWARAPGQSASDGAGGNETGDSDLYRPTITPREIAAARRARALARLPRVQVRAQRVSVSDGYQEEVPRRRRMHEDRLIAAYAAPLPDVVDSGSRRRRVVHIKNRNQLVSRSLEESPFAVGVRPVHRRGARPSRAKRSHSRQREDQFEALNRALVQSLDSESQSACSAGKELRALRAGGPLDPVGRGLSFQEATVRLRDKTAQRVCSGQRQRRQDPEGASLQPAVSADPGKWAGGGTAGAGWVEVSPLRKANPHRGRVPQSPNAAGRGNDISAAKAATDAGLDAGEGSGCELPPISSSPHAEGRLPTPSGGEPPNAAQVVYAQKQ